MFGEKGLLRKRLLQNVNVLEPPYSVRYPELGNYLDPIVPGKEWEGMRLRRNLLAGNLVERGGWETVKLMGGERDQFSSMSNFVTENDPGFVDYEHLNFNLLSDAEVIEKKPGLKPLPFNKMGTNKDEFRKQ